MQYVDLSDAQILEKFRVGVTNIAAISLALGYPTLASLPYTSSNANKNVLSIPLSTGYSTTNVSYSAPKGLYSEVALTGDGNFEDIFAIADVHVKVHR